MLFSRKYNSTLNGSQYKHYKHYKQTPYVCTRHCKMNCVNCSKAYQANKKKKKNSITRDDKMYNRSSIEVFVVVIPSNLAVCFRNS